MNQHVTALLVTLLLTTDPAMANRDMAELYFSDKNPVLTRQEKQAMAIANKWKGHNTLGMAPTSGKKRRDHLFVWGSAAQCGLCGLASL